MPRAPSRKERGAGTGVRARQDRLNLAHLANITSVAGALCKIYSEIISLSGTIDFPRIYSIILFDTDT